MNNSLASKVKLARWIPIHTCDECLVPFSLYIIYTYTYFEKLAKGVSGLGAIPSCDKFNPGFLPPIRPGKPPGGPRLLFKPPPTPLDGPATGAARPEAIGGKGDRLMGGSTERLIRDAVGVPPAPVIAPPGITPPGRDVGIAFCGDD